jgi:alkanesulfonate monooxygenase SsuD/methylene tetrahydromethanopterin reductase-like flavin-dependent oxidoreductase (luciferase family)
MKFGILYNIEYYPHVHGSPTQYYSRILEQIEREEELGFESVWFGEHHYAGYSFGSPAVMAMAAAARTQRIRIGTGVSLVPLHQPLRLAEEYAQLDVLSGGRLEYGIGRGFLKLAYDLFGVDEAESHARYHEGAELILKAWTSTGPFSHDGRFFPVQQYTFFPKPLQQPHPPIYASGAITPESFVWAGRNGFHLATAFFLPAREQVRDNIARYRQALIDHHHDPAEKDVAGVYQMYCGATDEEARRDGLGHTVQYLRFFAGLDQVKPLTSGAFSHYQGGVSRAFGKISIEDMDQQRLLLIGSPERLVDHIGWAQEFYGTTYLLLEVGQGGAPHDKILRSLERFATSVMPFFKNKGAAPRST